MNIKEMEMILGRAYPLTWRDGRDSILPFWDLEMKRSRFLDQRLRDAEQVILALRRLLIAQDPSLPEEYDGKAWAEIEGMSSSPAV